MNGCVHLHFLKWILFISVVMVNIIESYSQNKGGINEINQNADSTKLIIIESPIPFYRYCLFGVYAPHEDGGAFHPTLGIRYYLIKKPTISCEFFFRYFKTYDYYKEIPVTLEHLLYFVFNYQTYYGDVSFLASFVVRVNTEKNLINNRFTYATSFVPTVGVNFIILKRINLAFRAGIGARSGTEGWGSSWLIPNWVTSHADISIGYNFNLRKKHENR